MTKKAAASSPAWDYEDLPEWTIDQFDPAKRAVGDKVVRPANGTLTRSGCPPLYAANLDGISISSSKRIAHVGFHGWSKEVSPRDIEIVREVSKLEARHGYDSQAFLMAWRTP